MWPPAFLAKHKTFVGNVAAMMTGKSVAAAIALVTMPITARLFSPSDFGVAAGYLAIVGIVSSIGSLRYEVTLVLPREDGEAVTLMALAHVILLLVCLAVSVVLGFFEITGINWPILEMLGDWKWLLPLGVFLTAGLQIQEHWLARKRDFKTVAATTVLGTVVNSATRIGSGILAGSSVIALISSNLLGTVSRLVLQKTASGVGVRAMFQHADFTSLSQVGRRYKDFPKLNAPAGLAFALGQNLPVLFFGAMFSPAVAGFYAMASRLSQAPIAVVANAVRRVFLQKAAAINNRGRSLGRAFLLTTLGLALSGSLPFGCLWIFGQPLLGGLLGNRWLEAGRYLEIMAPWLFMLWITAPSNPIFIVLRKQNIWLAMQILLTLLRLAAFALAFLLSASAEWALQAFVVATVAGSVSTIAVAVVLISRHVENIRDAESPGLRTGSGVR